VRAQAVTLSAVAATAHLLTINLCVGADDPRRKQVKAIAERVDATAARAVGASG